MQPGFSNETSDTDFFSEYSLQINFLRLLTLLSFLKRNQPVSSILLGIDMSFGIRRAPNEKHALRFSA